MERSGFIDTSKKNWNDSPSENEFYQLRLFGGVKIKKNYRENKKKPLTIKKEKISEEWPW
ncbi:MAG: hypothetical protein A2Y97_06575 [Nitrospirae bacterium RBG_13_39_12]|nr:MAG: hypothetical protein A2Y97_06575 [Nitrospirae bacterium RBG_13_39_12]